MINEGIYPTLSNEDYHADKESISRSAIMDFDKSPYNYWANHLNPERPKKDPTPQMVLGSAFHSFVLEPELFERMYIVKPEPVFLKDVGREIYDKYKNLCIFLENCGSTILTVDQSNTLIKMRESFQEKPEAIELLHNARIEHSFFWKDEASGLMVKARPDILHRNMIVDIKTAADASPRSFQRAMVDGGYHIQGAMIRDGVEKLEGNRIDTVINIVCETKYPYHIGIYIIDEEALDAGHRKYKQILLDIKRAIGHNEFPEYEIQTVGLPAWAL